MTGMVDIKKTPAARETAPDVWRTFRTEFDRLFDRFDRGFRLPSLSRMFDLDPAWGEAAAAGSAVPAVDVTEDESAYKITAELPGLTEKDIEVSMSGDNLVLKGEKRQDKTEKSENYYLSERSFGAFRRVFRLPEGVEHDKIAATFTHGVLTLTLPKSADIRKQQKKIEIKAS